MAEPYSQDLQGRPLTTYAYEQQTVAGTALVGGASATLGTAANYAGCKRLIVTVETAPVRVRMDGTAPTASVGTPYNAGDQVILFGPDIHTLQVIRSTAASALVNLEYSR